MDQFDFGPIAPKRNEKVESFRFVPPLDSFQRNDTFMNDMNDPPLLFPFPSRNNKNLFSTQTNFLVLFIFKKLAYYEENDYIDSEFYREVQNAVVNDFEALRQSCRYEHVDMSYENIAMLQTKSFERQISTFIVSNNNQTEIESDLAPMLTTIKNHNLGYRIRCSVKNCFNRHSKDLSFFGCPSDFTLRKKWIEKCGLSVDPTKKVKLRVRVCRIHFDDDCFKNTKLKNRLRPGAVPSLFLDNGINTVHPIFLSSSNSKTNNCRYMQILLNIYFINKSIATTDEMYFSRNEIKECTAFTNDLYHQPVDFSCVKIEPLVDDDLQTNSLKVLCLSQYN
ncbi:hypothetical protein QTP88_023768 [Uroleucon formosanum]